MRWVSDRAYLARLYHRQFGRWPDLERPGGFNEKILFKILNDRRPYLTLFADKLRVRDYVRRTAPMLLLPALYWWSDRAEDLPYEALPKQFVLKANHGSGWNYVVRDKASVRRRDLVKLAATWLRSDFTLVGREWAYTNIRRAAYAEQLLQDDRHDAPPDYKLFVFGGTVRVIQVDRDRFTRHTQILYDERWNRIEGTVAAAQGEPIARPESLAVMLEAARSLSAGVDFVRVDLYEIGGEAYFGELTSSPNKGLSPFRPASLDQYLGAHFQPDDYSKAVPLQYDPDAGPEAMAAKF
jgi:TupA-like ATPgrasp